jgi:hypothetical protein
MAAPIARKTAGRRSNNLGSSSKAEVAMREPWKIPYDYLNSTRLACGAVDPITLPRRIHIRVKAASLQPARRGGKRARGRICS